MRPLLALWCCNGIMSIAIGVLFCHGICNVWNQGQLSYKARQQLKKKERYIRPFWCLNVLRFELFNRPWLATAELYYDHSQGILAARKTSVLEKVYFNTLSVCRWDLGALESFCPIFEDVMMCWPDFFYKGRPPSSGKCKPTLFSSSFFPTRNPPMNNLWKAEANSEHGQIAEGWHIFWLKARICMNSASVQV